MTKVTHKMVRLDHSGPIFAKGGICGPITTPYLEDVGTIFRMITSGVKVVEIVSGGEPVVLTTSNYDRDNTVVVEPKKKEEKKDDKQPGNNAHGGNQNQNPNKGGNPNQNKGGNQNKNQHPAGGQQQPKPEVKPQQPAEKTDSTGTGNGTDTKPEELEEK